MIGRLFRKTPKSLDGDEIDEGLGDLAANDAARKRQQLWLYGGGSVAVVAAMVYILQPSKSERLSLDQLATDNTVKVSTDDMVGRNMSDKEWMALSEGQQQNMDTRLKGVEGQSGRIQQLEAQIQGLEGEKSAMTADGTRVLGAYEAENAQLKEQLAAKAAAPAGPTSMYGPGAPGTYQQRPGGPDGTAGAAGTGTAAVTRSNEIKLVSFGAEGGTAARMENNKTTTYTDSINYLPPNSIATARVIVGVDAATSVKSQGDPLPVVLRITGPARSVYSEGKLLRTSVQGCMVNGAAQGDLSSEKVYVKLLRMTCPQPGGRFAVSEVKGFIAFGGKTGVRGRVVSREGALVGQAFIAGLAGGFGRGFSANTDSMLTGNNVTINGKRQQLGLGDIAQGGLGQGVATSADLVSKYLIERAEQYQPVIEMPTGVDVEVVFLDGVFIRN
jgi:conjugal transfer pilus assembly protein TraB